VYAVSSSFLNALKSPVHTFRSKMVVLDTDFNPVYEFVDAGYQTNDTTSIMVDGSVDIDVTRLTRRTFTATVLNPSGIWSPRSDWGGLFYVNRLVRMYRGIDYGSGQEMVPVGTFLIDHADVAVERNMSVVVLSGSDLWKKFGKSMFPRNKTWASGTSINTIITYIADQAGVTRLNLDPLSSRAASDREIGKDFSVEQGDNRGEALAELCKAYAIDIYFDPDGRLTTQDFQTPGDKAVVFEYDPTMNNNLITVKSSYSDDNLYNSVLVIGTKDKDNVVISRVRDTDPTSVTSVDRIGERVFKYESDKIGTQALADKTAESLFYKHVLVNEDITLESICNPAFEGNDVVHVDEREFSQLNSNFRLRAFTVPLSSSRQTLRLLREIRLT
jgi:hypothetical protein